MAMAAEVREAEVLVRTMVPGRARATEAKDLAEEAMVAVAVRARAVAARARERVEEEMEEERVVAASDNWARVLALVGPERQ